MQAIASKLILVGAVVAAGPSGLWIDKGLLDGLRFGDLGAVHYRLSVGSEARRVDVGWARVAAVEDRRARLEPVGEASSSWRGHLIDFELPARRLAPAGLLIAMARHRLEEQRLDEALGYLDSWRQLSQAADPGGETTGAESGAAEALRVAAEQLLRRGEPDRAESYLRWAQRLQPEAPELASLMDRLSLRTGEMVEVPAGSHRIGVDLEQARYFNQQPSFTVELAGFSLDRRPVTRVEYQNFRHEAPTSRQPGDFAAGLTWSEAEAFCRSRGKRLPTELEWEAAVRQRAVEASAPLYEWTASWYLPYPGNREPENEYGETYRVLRGHAGPGAPDPTERRFLAPESRNSRVGFRCARDAGVR